MPVSLESGRDSSGTRKSFRNPGLFVFCFNHYFFAMLMTLANKQNIFFSLKKSNSFTFFASFTQLTTVFLLIYQNLCDFLNPEVDDIYSNM
ncbi:hypothetical protein Hanom_Chr05g00434731 [Helianthus anomalus]